MNRFNKEQIVFLGVLLLVVVLGAGRLRSVEEKSVSTIRPADIEEFTWTEPDTRVADRDGAIWSFERRDVFDVPREVEDMPPVAMDLPPLPPRPLVAPFLEPAPADGIWHAFAQKMPESLASGVVLDTGDLELFLDAVSRRLDDEDELDEILAENPGFDPQGLLETIDAAIEDRDEVDLGEIPEAVDALAAIFEVAAEKLRRPLEEDAPAEIADLYRAVTGREPGEAAGGSGFTGAAAVVDAALRERARELAAAEEIEARDPDELFDRVYLDGGSVTYGRILDDDPLALLGEETEVPGRYRPVEGARFAFAILDEDSGRRIGSTTFDAGRVESLAVASTLENEIRLRRRKLRGDAPGQLAFARWCAAEGAVAEAAEAFRSVFESDRGYREEAARGLVGVLREDLRFDELARTLDAIGEAGIESAWLELERGWLLRSFGLDAAARDAYERCVSLDPGDGEAWLALGELRLAEGEAEGAFEAFQRAERGLGDDEAGVARAIAGQVAARLRSGDVEAAGRLCERGLDRVSGSDRPLRLARARVAMASGDLEAAESALRAIREGGASTDSARRDLELYRGVVRARKGDYFEAKRHLESAAELDPVDAFWPHAALGFLHLTTGRRDRAFDAIGRALEVAPNEPYGHYLLGRFYRTTGADDDALAAFERARELAPEVTEILAELGALHVRRGETREARLCLEEVVRRRPESAEARAFLAVARLAARDFRAAREAVEDALRLEDEMPLALATRAFLEYRSGTEDDVYRAIGSLDRTAELLGGDTSRPLAAYALRYRGEIEENRDKCQWWDGFNRTQLERDWQVNQRHGVQVRLVDDQIRFDGTQKTRDEELTWIERPMEHSKIVRLDARLSVPPGPKIRAGVQIVTRRKADDPIQGGLLFGRDLRGNVAYRVVDRSGEGDWVVLDRAWPADPWVSLTVENQDPDEGLFRLFVNGEEVAAGVEARSLRKPRGEVRIGAFGTAGIGADWRLGVEDVRVIMIKDSER